MLYARHYGCHINNSEKEIGGNMGLVLFIFPFFRLTGGRKEASPHYGIRGLASGLHFSHVAAKKESVTARARMSAPR